MRRIAACFAVAIVVACSSSDDHGTTPSATAAAIAGAPDAHCGTKVVEVDPASCNNAPAAAADYGPAMVGDEGDDDDCKYHIKWSAASGDTTTTASIRPLHETTAGGTGTGGLVTFTVTLTAKKTGAPVTGAPITIEAFLDDTHPAPNTTQTVKETAPGTYRVGPVGFDVSGKWTVRFHVHDECKDSETSPHGHAAFFAQIDVK
jgi:hypothetical protein